MKKMLCIFAFIALVACFLAFELLGGEFFLSASAAEFDDAGFGDVPSMILLESHTGSVLYEKNSDKKLPIASITKLMTTKIVLDEIEGGNLSLDDKFVVSKNAADQIGSQAFLDEGEEYSIEDLLKSTIIVSANDSAMALAEAVCGSENEFVLRMNKEATKLGMTNTHFENPTGLPAAGHFSSSADIAVLAKDVISRPLYSKYAKVFLDELAHPSGRKTQLASTCKKFKNYQGFEGGKTGHTNEAGYCFAASAKRGDMSLIAVVLGAKNSDTRFDATKKLFDYGFSEFKTIEILNTEKPIEKVPLKFSTKGSMNVFAKEGFSVFAKKEEKTNFEIVSNITRTKVPIAEGDAVGFVQVVLDGKVVFETQLVTKETYKHVGYSKILENLAESF